MRFHHFVLLSALWACTAPNDTDRPDDTVDGTNDSPIDTLPDDGTDTTPDDPGMSVNLIMRTYLDGVEEPCMAKIVDAEGLTLAEGMTFEELTASGVKPGDILYVIPGTQPITPSTADFVEGLDPPTGSFYRHQLEDGSSALALAVPVTVPENGELEDVDVDFHRFADGEWTLAYRDSRDIWKRDRVRTYYIDDPNTGEFDPVLATQWGTAWGVINGSSIIPLPGLQDNITVAGTWRVDGMVDLTVNWQGALIELTAFPGTVDPR